MTTPTNSTVSAEQAREALDEVRAIRYSMDFESFAAASTTLESFIAQHSTEPVAAGWRLLDVGVPTRPDDEEWHPRRRVWQCVGPNHGNVDEFDAPIRRRFAAQGQSDVIELRLCEQSHLILRPNQLYRLTVAPDCAQCKETAAIYEQRPTGGGDE